MFWQKKPVVNYQNNLNKMTLAETVNFILGALTIIGQIYIVVMILGLVTGKGKQFVDFFTGRTGWFVFLIALVSTLGSLTYSDILGYEPCKLCWLQRILMYPQVILLSLAIYKKEQKAILDYSLVLSIVGAIIALYHYLLQLGWVPELACSAVGYSVSCAQRFVMQFDYITIPMMALTAFLMIIVTISALKLKKDN